VRVSARRTTTLLLSGVLLVVLVALTAVTPVPYVAYQPGPSYDTLGEVSGTPVIAVEGRETFPTEGRLDLTTISVRSRLTLAEALRDWFDRERAVVPRELVFPPGQTDDDVRRRNQERILESENAATVAALDELGVPFELAVTVQGVEPGLPAEGRLEVGDVLTAVDGDAVSSSQEVREAVSGRPVGSEVRLSYLRDGRPGEAVLTTAASESDPSRSVVGVVLVEQPEAPFEVSISLQGVGGPSAGLMFALGILDKLGPESLTGGLHIAGTGTIDGEGAVGPIGGIAQKLVASADLGADAFLVPEGNCEEARGAAPEGLLLVRVSSLDSALDALGELRAGRTPEGC
jgi:Lon-like protease